MSELVFHSKEPRRSLQRRTSGKTLTAISYVGKLPEDLVVVL